MQHYSDGISDYRIQPTFMQLTTASIYSGLSIDTLRHRIAAGQLQAYRTGKASNSRIVIKISDLDRLLEPIPMAAV